MKNIKTFIILVMVLMLGIVPMHTTAQQDIKIVVDGVNIKCDQAPIIENGRTLVPFRAISEALDAKVSWNEQTKEVTACKDNDTVSLKIGNKCITKNNVKTETDVAAKIVNGRTMVPVRAISNCLNAKVDWDESTRTVIINTKTQPTAKPTAKPTAVPTAVPTAKPTAKPTAVPTAVPTAKPTQQPSATTASEFERRVLDLVNEERAKNGLKPLVWSDELANVARKHSQDMATRNFFSHTNPDGLSPFDRIKNAGISYRAAGENIAAGQTTPEAVMESWMNSSGHRANILNGNYTQLGVGCVKGGSYGIYWTQCFMTPAN